MVDYPRIPILSQNPRLESVNGEVTKFSVNYGSHVVSLIPQGSAPELIALNIVKPHAGPGVPLVPRNQDETVFHAVFDEEHARAMFCFLGAWLHGAHRS